MSIILILIPQNLKYKNMNLDQDPRGRKDAPEKIPK
jgi:hypothetical protein